jgi:hypothetical protein
MLLHAVFKNFLFFWEIYDLNQGLNGMSTGSITGDF